MVTKRVKREEKAQECLLTAKEGTERRETMNLRQRIEMTFRVNEVLERVP